MLVKKKLEMTVEVTHAYIAWCGAAHTELNILW
jgi:hypothetical protein